MDEVNQGMVTRTDDVHSVPEVDVNAPLKAPIGDPTDYQTALTPENKFFYVAGIFVFALISLIACGLFVIYLTGF